MLYELTTVTCPLMDVDDGSERIRAWTQGPEATGDLLGCWRTDIGVLGRLLVLRSFATPQDIAAERTRALLSAAPFGVRGGTGQLRVESFERLPFLPAVVPSSRGKVYEFRTYHLEPGGLAPTIAGWQEAMEPARAYTSHLVVNLYALDGAPRITHIWAFDSLEQRTAVRSAAYAAGVWPPRGGPENIAVATSTIALPETFSPLC